MTANPEATSDQTRETVHFSPLDPTLADDFWGRINGLRDQYPVAWSDQRWSDTNSGFWVINDYPDVMAAATNWNGFTSELGATPVQFDLDVLRQIPLENDPPFHRGVRRLLNPFFTAEAQAAGEEGIREKVEMLLDRCIDEGGEIDFITSFVRKLPPLVFFLTYLGQDESEIAWIIETLDVLFVAPERAVELAPRLLAWCGELLEQRRAEGRRDDLTGTVAHMGLDGSDGLEMTERQRIETLNLLVMAGMETTMSGLGTVAVHLAQNQALRAELGGADEQRIDRTVDEFLRFETPVPTAGRTLTKDVEMSGCPMNGGERVLLNWAAANRDPGQFPNPDSLDFTRKNHASHVAFGAGIHRCLGTHLARREMKATIRGLAALGTFEGVPGFDPQYRSSFVRSPISLPVRLGR